MYFDTRKLSSYTKDKETESGKDQPPEAERSWVHLLDGGLFDNVGLRGPYNALTTIDSPWTIKNKGHVKTTFVITANAKTRPGNDWDNESSAPDLIDVFNFTATGPMDNFSFDSSDLSLEPGKRLIPEV